MGYLKKIYELPLTGKLIRRDPPDGDKDNPLRPLPIVEYFSELKIEGNWKQYEVLKYDIEEDKAIVEIEACEKFFAWLDSKLNKTTEKQLYALTKVSKIIKEEP